MAGSWISRCAVAGVTWVFACSPGHAAQLAPTMFGDFIDPNNLAISAPRRLSIPASYSPFKIAENESPRPQDRVFLTYNFYKNELGTEDIHRESIGVEKALLGGDASLGLRLPFFQIDGDARNRNAKVDDLSLLFKYAWIHDREAVLATGVVLTLPSGASYKLVRGGERHIVQTQPYAGYLWGREDWYVHGFASVVVPSDDAAPAILFNDLGVGYWLYRGEGILTAAVPTLEVHVNTPLTHRDASDAERRRDSVDLTGGVHFNLGRRSSVGIAAGTPVTHPRLFDAEVLGQFNWAF